MIRKVGVILITGFLFQFLISCDMNCNPGPTVEMEYTGLLVDARAKIDNQVSPIEDSVRKEDFNLFVDFDEADKQLAFHFLNLGFSHANALDCGPYFIYSDKVKQLSIIMINAADMTESTDVTALFGLKTASNTYSVQDLINSQLEEERGKNYFNLSLIESENLYKSGSFEITATLESGAVFTKKTEHVAFY